MQRPVESHENSVDKFVQVESKMWRGAISYRIFENYRKNFFFFKNFFKNKIPFGILLASFTKRNHQTKRDKECCDNQNQCFSWASFYFCFWNYWRSCWSSWIVKCIFYTFIVRFCCCRTSHSRNIHCIIYYWESKKTNCFTMFFLRACKCKSRSKISFHKCYFLIRKKLEFIFSRSTWNPSNRRRIFPHFRFIRRRWCPNGIIRNHIWSLLFITNSNQIIWCCIFPVISKASKSFPYFYSASYKTLTTRVLSKNRIWRTSNFCIFTGIDTCCSYCIRIWCCIQSYIFCFCRHISSSCSYIVCCSCSTIEGCVFRSSGFYNIICFCRSSRFLSKNRKRIERYSCDCQEWNRSTHHKR